MSKTEFLQRQAIELEQLLAEAEDDPVLKPQLEQRLADNLKELLASLKPCPFCGSTNLEIMYCEEGCCGGKPRAVECTCGGALWLDNLIDWNQRTTQITTDDGTLLRNENQALKLELQQLNLALKQAGLKIQRLLSS